ncbi:integrin alpha-L-like isoform X2 [Struthio camelus]|uniref:integrin alpha-L-like isoform X2 n=1 Tax=Struthio camelus TaxID=8801 RepID=UPI003603B7BD
MHPDAWVPGLWCTRTPGSLTHSAPGRLGPHEAQSPWGGRGGPGIRDRRRLRRRQKETGAPAPPQCVAAAAAAASMAGPGLVLLGIALAGLSSAAGFNLDPVPFRLLAPNISESFGHQVLQLNGSRILVGAPAAAAEGAGRLYECRVDTGSCRELPLADNGSVPHLGMALARTDTGAIACGPGLSRECDRNVYVSGLCYELGPRLGAPRVLAPGYQGCLPGTVDLAFLFDGSNSMTSAQFGTIRDFMVDVMEQLHNSSIHFAAVQFSDRTRTEFTLRDYAARPEPRALLRHVQQLRSLTDTFSAITYVAKNIFTPENGARAGAKRVMIIITDGDATDTGDVSAAEERGILRYIIGVGNNFGSPDTRLYLSQFASQPSTEFVKVLDSFEKLKGLFKELQAKIYDIEGTSTHNRFHLELSSSGFSLAVAGGRVVTGAVGADDWAGGLLELAAPGDVFVPSPALAANLTDSYLGYAVASMARRGRALYAAGAPRHGHVGRVVVFEAPPPGAGPWRPVQFLPGQQIGSYFGAVLCALDLDADGLTDLLLVGAHLHYDGRRGGRVHVYRWHGETLEAAGELLGAPGHPLGRFGAALAALGDLDGDGWAEAAVGAPLEDAEAGAVYVFRGHSQGLGPGYSQRVAGQRVAPGLRHLGQALDGALDVTGDGLGDVAVGARGAVAVLRSRPVLWVTPQVTFRPDQLPVTSWGCGEAAGAAAGAANATEAPEAADGGDWDGPAGTQRPAAAPREPERPGVQLRLCFGVRLAPAGRREPPEVALSLALSLDAGRARSRGVLGDGRPRRRGPLRLRTGATLGPRCLEERIDLEPCLDDIMTPMRVAIDFSLEPSADGPILPPGTTTAWSEGSWATALSCRERVEAEAGAGARTLWCNVSHPVFHAGRETHIELTFDVLRNRSWDAELQLTATASSDNEPNSSLADNAASWRLPVRYLANIMASGLGSSTAYLNFSSRHPENKTLLHLYELKLISPWDLGMPRPTVTAFVLVPHELQAGLTWAKLNVTAEPGGTCHPDAGDTSEAVCAVASGLQEACDISRATTYRCHLGVLVTTATIRVAGVVQPPPKIEVPARSHLCSRLCFAVDTRRFASRGDVTSVQVTTKVELLREVNLRWLYFGSALGGLGLLLLIVFGLAKCGFFKRDYRERLDQDAVGDRTGDNEDAGEAGDAPAGDPEGDTGAGGLEPLQGDEGAL